MAPLGGGGRWGLNIAYNVAPDEGISRSSFSEAINHWDLNNYNMFLKTSTNRLQRYSLIHIKN
jgi:hypothetical protein